ncbi:MAG: dihydroorotase [Pseudomonadota bacterium]
MQSDNSSSSSRDIAGITIRRPDDWHVHLRDGQMLEMAVAHTARQFERAIVMPNLRPPVVDTQSAIAYRDRIMAALPGNSRFTPLMTAYLTDNTDAADIARGFADGVLTACKYYPANATTNSAQGVTDFRNVYPVLETMQRIGMPLLLHGEVTDAHVDIFDREAVFIEQVFAQLVTDFPALKCVFEHITTEDAVDFVLASGEHIAATVTPHHLTVNRTDMLAGGIRPHLYCLPILKRERHRQALRRAATSGNAKFFLGTDSAPHSIGDKESDCGCAGIFNAPTAMEVYASVFDEEGALDQLEGFASLNGPHFYGLAVNDTTVTLERQALTVAERYQAGDKVVVPFFAGQTLPWRYV